MVDGPIKVRCVKMFTDAFHASCNIVGSWQPSLEAPLTSRSLADQCDLITTDPRRKSNGHKLTTKECRSDHSDCIIIMSNFSTSLVILIDSVMTWLLNSLCFLLRTAVRMLLQSCGDCMLHDLPFPALYPDAIIYNLSNEALRRGPCIKV